MTRFCFCYYTRESQHVLAWKASGPPSPHIPPPLTPMPSRYLNRNLSTAFQATRSYQQVLPRACTAHTQIYLASSCAVQIVLNLLSFLLHDLFLTPGRRTVPPFPFPGP